MPRWLLVLCCLGGATLVAQSGILIPAASLETDVVTVGGSPDRSMTVADVRALPCPPLCAPTPPASEDSFTLVVLPDTQGYSASRPDLYLAQANWIADNKTSLNIAFVAHEGDIVTCKDCATEWQNADAAHDVIDATCLPNGVLAGNHDAITGSATLMMNYFGPSRPWPAACGGGTHGSQAWWLGSTNYSTTSRMIASAQAIPGTNFLVCHAFYLGDTGLLGETTIEAEGNDTDGKVIAAKKALRFCRDVVLANPTKDAILVTHADLLTPSSTVTEGTRQTGYDEVFTYGVLPFSQYKFVFSGHQLGQQAEARRTTIRSDGTRINEVLANYQSRPCGATSTCGDGWLRAVLIDPVARTATFQTYSPSRTEYELDANSAFTLDF